MHHAQDRASLLEIMHSISFGSLYPDLRCLEGHLNDRFVKHPVLVPGKMWSRNKERQLLSWYVPAYKVKWNEHSVRAKHLMRCIELWSLLCQVHMMWTAAMLSQRALTVFSTQLRPQVVVAIPTGRSSFTVLYNEAVRMSIPLHLGPFIGMECTTAPTTWCIWGDYVVWGLGPWEGLGWAPVPSGDHLVPPFKIHVELLVDVTVGIHTYV